MDILSFIAALVASLAWPSAILVGLLVFRRSLQALLPAIKMLKYKDFQAEFTEDLQRVSREADAAKLPSGQVVRDLPVGGPEASERKYTRLLTVSPAAAVLEAWQDLERALHGVATGWDYDNPQDDELPNTSTVAKRLHDEGKLDAVAFSLFNELRRLRNQVAHHGGYAVTEAQAYEYAFLASRLAARIRQTHGPKPSLGS